MVEERKMSRKLSPLLSPAGIRLQSEGTSVGGAATVPDCSTSLTSTVSARAQVRPLLAHSKYVLVNVASLKANAVPSTSVPPK